MPDDYFQSLHECGIVDSSKLFRATVWPARWIQVVPPHDDADDLRRGDGERIVEAREPRA